MNRLTSVRQGSIRPLRVGIPRLQRCGRVHERTKGLAQDKRDSGSEGEKCSEMMDRSSHRESKPSVKSLYAVSPVGRRKARKTTMAHKITLIPGDGIGPEVTRAADVLALLAGRAETMRSVEATQGAVFEVSRAEVVPYSVARIRRILGSAGATC